MFAAFARTLHARACRAVPSPSSSSSSFAYRSLHSQSKPSAKVWAFSGQTIGNKQAATFASQSYSHSHSHSSSSSSSFSSRWSRFLSFLRSPLLHRGGGGLLLLTVGGGACYYAATGSHQRELLDAIFPDRLRAREQAEWDARRPLSQVGLLQDTNEVILRQQRPQFPQVLIGIIGINIAVFLAHKSSNLHYFMERHFYTSYLHLVQGRLFHTTLTSAFSHRGGLHLFVNMFTLSSLAPPVIYIIGEQEFVVFYLLAGIVSSLCESFSSSLFRRLDWRYAAHRMPSLGASGAVLGVAGLIWALLPDSQYTIMLIPKPFRMDQLAPCLAAFDLAGFGYKLFNGPHSGLPLGHMAHFSGLMFGYAYANTILRNRYPHIKARMERNEKLKKMRQLMS